MNNYYTLIYLTEHLDATLRGLRYHTGTSPHSNVWEGLFGAGGKRARLVFSTEPAESALFTDRYRPLKKSNAMNFFEPLREQTCTGARLTPDDRLLTLEFEGKHHLLFQLFGNRSNLFMIRDGRIEDAFKKPERHAGRNAPTPATPRTKPPVGNRKSDSDDASRILLAHDPKLPRHLISLLVQKHKLQEADAREIGKLADRIGLELKKNAEFRVLTDGSLCLIPSPLLDPETLRRFENVNDAIRFCYYRASGRRRFEKRASRHRSAIDRERTRVQRAIGQLEEAEKALQRAEEYEKKGHLLMAHAHEAPDLHAGELRIPDLYEPGQKLRIAVRPDLTVAANAGRYYDRAAKARRRVRESERRGGELRERLRELDRLESTFAEVTDLRQLEEWEKKESDRLGRLGFTEGEKRPPPSQPWRTRRLGEFEIWIGRNAASNDRLTAAAHKEDIWLHARGAGGSHLVIRMNNRKENPPRRLLEQAASWAAWHSSLRNSGLVPVIVTRKKYISKPRGAPAGSVRVTREEILTVKPQKPDT